MKYQRKTFDSRRQAARNWTGERIGKLLVIGVSANRSKGDAGRTLWICRCDCGKEIEISSHSWSKKDPQYQKTHCGCSGKNGKKHLDFDEYNNAHKVTSNYISGANRRNIEWGLSVDEAINLFNSNCYYCGKQPSNIYSGIKSAPPFLYNGIDRLDSGGGYFPDNCVPCCTRCNYAKMGKHVDDFLEFIKEVYEHRIKK